ncbi:hypothetical protein KIV40_34280 [Vibrio sp. D173a]|uniref:hypothetical protein n=1 Tax=Vibrio sp. D173a TaxID=2836349 RepID=UPI002553BF00|nr:hypothetical protein [Vibrio sp. D173a]MDK9760216.1 hypothetical protein [Vibrio sp. D173a]
MKTSIKLISLLSISVLTACGGGGGGSTAQPATPAAAQDIVAQRDFSFDVGEKITLSIDYSGSTKGALHLYSEAAFVKADGEVIPDPVSRITTIYPDLTDEVKLEVNTNWDSLYVRWVPMTSSESEQTWSITLGQPSNSYHLTF